MASLPNTALSVVVGLGAVSCRPAPVSPPPSAEAPPRVEPEPSPKPAAAEAARPSLAGLIAQIVLVRPSSTIVELEYVDEICEREGFPETLSDAAAAELEDAKPGSPVTIVHEQGQTVALVASAGCQEEEEYVAESATLLTLDRPAGPKGSASPVELALGAPNVAFVGTAPSADARLDSPRPLVWKSALGERVRGLVQERVGTIVARRTKQCGEEIAEGDIRPPTAAATEAAVQSVEAWQLDAPTPVVWVLLEHPAITFTCYAEDDADAVGLLIDVNAGTDMVMVESNNGVELQWVTDLDGDGTQEGLVDVHWLEDGGHEIILLSDDGSGWGETSLYAFDGP